MFLRPELISSSKSSEVPLSFEPFIKSDSSKMISQFSRDVIGSRLEWRKSVVIGQYDHASGVCHLDSDHNPKQKVKHKILHWVKTHFLLYSGKKEKSNNKNSSEIL